MNLFFNQFADTRLRLASKFATIPNNATKFLSEFDVNDETYYSILGSGFLVREFGKVWAITARHTIRDIDPNTIRIPRCMKCQTFNKVINRLNYNLAGEIDDTDQADVTIFEIDDSYIFECCSSQLTPAESISNSCRANDRILVRGFPNDKLARNEIDYEKRHITIQAANFAGSIVSQSKLAGCINVTLRNSFDLDTYDGISGAPVYTYNHKGFQLVGMMLRGSNPEAGQSFLSISFPLEYIRKYCRNIA